MKPWDNTVSIRSKIVITIIVISTCVALLGSALAFGLSREMLTTHFVSDLKIAATQHVNEVSFMLDNASASIDALAQEKEIIDLVKEQNEFTIASASMTVAHFNARNEFYSFDVLDVLGNVLYSTNPTKIGVNKSEHDFYKNGITGVASVEVSKGSTLQNVELFAYAPIKTKEGRIVGVVVGEYNPEHIFSFLETSKGALQFDHAIITDEYGVVVYSDRKELLFKNMGTPSALAKVKIAERWHQYAIRVIDENESDIQNAIETRGESVTFFKKNGSWFDSKMILVSRLSDKPFSLILESNIEYIFNQVFRATIFIVLLMLFMAFIIALFVALYINRFLRPISEMLRFTKDVSNEKFDAPLLITSNDEKEFQELGKELAAMAKKLKGVKEHLEDAIKEKTKTISGKIEELEEAKISALSMLEDLTVSRNKLEIENAKNNAVLSSIDNGVLVTDKEGRLLFANHNIETLFNWKVSEKLGSRFDRLMNSAETFQGESITEAFNIIKAALQGTSISGHFVIVRNDGKKIPLYYAASPIMQAGTSIGSVTVVRDITEEKKLDDSRTTFISTAAHQLRTPLTAVSWFGEMLAEGIGGTLTDKQKDMVNEINSGVKRMMDLVSFLLKMARIEAGRVRVTPESLHPADIAREVIQSLSVLSTKKQQVVTLDSDLSSEYRINMDREFMRQVFLNLLANAIQYSPKKGVIHIAIKDMGEVIEASVTDTGIGIPAEHQAEIFKKFYRAPNAVRSVPEGSGLGLALVKTLVEQWGGTIAFTSEVNKGSTFIFTIPKRGMEKREGEVPLTVAKDDVI